MTWPHAAPPRDNELRGRGVAVVGAGASGVAAANAACRRGALVRLVDDGERSRPANLDEAVEFASLTHDVGTAELVILSPGIPEGSPVRADVARGGAEVIGELELFARLCPAPIVAVTGTDGKSTVTTMIGSILQAGGHHAVVGGNLGNALTGELERIEPASVVVAEVSAFQLTTVSTFHPAVAVLTNLAEDHLDYHGSFARYHAAKRRIFARMTEGDVAVLGADCPRARATELPASIVRRSASAREHADAHAERGQLILRGRVLMPRADLPLAGEHNVLDALLAALAADALGLAHPVIADALRSYRPLRHRLERFHESAGIHFVDDSKATNPHAAAAGLRATEGPVVLLAGGCDKGLPLDAFSELVRERARRVILFGAAAPSFARAIGKGASVAEVATLEEAVTAARACARAGDTVLLSPACSSFDAYDSYAQRGEAFQRLVRQAFSDRSSRGAGQ